LLKNAKHIKTASNLVKTTKLASTAKVANLLRTSKIGNLLRPANQLTAGLAQRLRQTVNNVGRHISDTVCFRPGTQILVPSEPEIVVASNMTEALETWDHDWLYLAVGGMVIGLGGWQLARNHQKRKPKHEYVTGVDQLFAADDLHEDLFDVVPSFEIEPASENRSAEARGAALMH